MGRDGMIFGIEDPVEYTDNTNMRSADMSPYSRLIHTIIFTALRDLKSKENYISKPAKRWLYHPDADELCDWVGLDMDLIRDRLESNPELKIGTNGLKI